MLCKSTLKTLNFNNYADEMHKIENARWWGHTIKK